MRPCRPARQDSANFAGTGTGSAFAVYVSGCSLIRGRRGRRGRGGEGGCFFGALSIERFVGLVMGMGRMGRHKGSTGCICGEWKVWGEGVGARDTVISREN
jgi:hypothetical protein